MDRRDHRHGPRYQCVMCIYGWACLIILGPPVIWLALVTADQSIVQCSIQDFYVFSNTTNQSLIYFDLKLQNDDKEYGVYYGTLNLTFSYYVNGPNPNPNPHPNPSGGIIWIANYTIPGFHQGLNKQTHRRDYVLARGFSWEEVSNNGSSSKAVFRVNLASKLKIKFLFWTSKRRNWMAWADLEVNGITGKKVKKKGITMKKNKHPTNGWGIFVLIFLLLVVLPLPCWMLLVGLFLEWCQE